MNQTIVFAGAPGVRIKVTQPIAEKPKVTILTSKTAHLVNLEKAA